ncbi:MAG: hypothetical protein M3Y87_13360 [Myxococcota bacterium]|nr:hypothetical protein [Myxococcota bacterium]
MRPISGRFLLFSILALAALGGCGSKTRLYRPDPLDAGLPSDGGVDAGIDAGPDGGGGVVVDCGRSEQFTTPRREIVLVATTISAAPIVREGWEIVAMPPESMATNAPITSATTALTPDLLGTWQLRFEAVDAAGRSGTCTVRVQSVVGPPIALCPEEGELRTPVSEPLTIFGDAFDDEAVVSVGWTQLSGPAPARLTVVGGAGAIVEMIADVAGRYELELRVTDADGAEGSCRIVVLVTAPPSVVCPGEPVRAPTRRPVTVSAMAIDDLGIASTRWELITRPDGSATTIAPASGLSTTMTPDRRGEYVLVFTATDDDGLSASCEVVVIGIPTPPDAMCPAVIETSPLTPTEIVATAIDDGTIRTWSWRVTEVPPGSRPAAPSPPNAARTTFTPDLAGEYRLRLTVTDDDGDTDECETLVRAISGDGLRIEVFWDTDGTDMDTHLLRPGARAWFDGSDDCYYANCVSFGGGSGLAWGGPGENDDPRLDLDDTNGFGPENINIMRPGAGTYRVGVHAFRGFARVTVRIYCGGSTTTPRQTFGPVAIDDRRVWRVADVDITAAGCTIRDLATAGGPNIITNEMANAGP